MRWTKMHYLLEFFSKYYFLNQPSEIGSFSHGTIVWSFMARKGVSNLPISSLLTESTLYSAARDRQRTTRKKDAFLPRGQHTRTDTGGKSQSAVVRDKKSVWKKKKISWTTLQHSTARCLDTIFSQWTLITCSNQYLKNVSAPYKRVGCPFQRYFQVPVRGKKKKNTWYQDEAPVSIWPSTSYYSTANSTEKKVNGIPAMLFCFFTVFMVNWELCLWFFFLVSVVVFWWKRTIPTDCTRLSTYLPTEAASCRAFSL